MDAEAVSCMVCLAVSPDFLFAADKILGWSSGQPAPVSTPSASPAVFYGTSSPMNSATAGNSWTRIPTPSPSTFNAFSPALAPLKEGTEGKEIAPPVNTEKEGGDIFSNRFTSNRPVHEGQDSEEGRRTRESRVISRDSHRQVGFAMMDPCIEVRAVLSSYQRLCFPSFQRKTLSSAGSHLDSTMGKRDKTPNSASSRATTGDPANQARDNDDGQRAAFISLNSLALTLFDLNLLIDLFLISGPSFAI
jgi:hypothetical protein